MARSVSFTSGAVTVEVVSGLFDMRGLVADAEEVQIQGALAIIEVWAEQVTAWMKKNKRWQRRTGNAEDSLGVVQTVKEDVIELVLTGGVFYMKYLEQYFRDALGNPRFEILRPALELWADVLIERLGAQRD